jgi:putative transposase
MKYHVTYPNAFDTLEDARRWMGDFVHWYNNKEHMHSSIGYVTPVRSLSNEMRPYSEPESSIRRTWEINREVVLNPAEK